MTKYTQAKVDKQGKKTRHQSALIKEPVDQSQLCRIHDDDHDEENKQYMDMIHGRTHFTFIMMHLLSYFCDNICQFGNIPMYSTKIGELAHMMQIKDR